MALALCKNSPKTIIISGIGYFAANCAPLDYLLFIAYLLLFTWLVTRLRFFRESGISRPIFIILFLLKVMAGIFYGWMGVYYAGTAQMVDTWHYHEQARIEYAILWDNPGEYFSNLFISHYPGGYGGFFASSDSYWNDLKSNVFIKFVSILHFFSQENYYVNVIFYSFLSFFGPVALFRVLKEQYPRQRIPILIGIFLAPSFLYWCSGLHKEGFLFLGLSLIVYHSYRLMQNRKGYGLRIGGILLGLLLLFLLRNFLIVVLLPALLAWVLARRYPARQHYIFAGVYVLFVLLFFTSRYIDEGFNMPQVVVDKQQAFLKLQGYSSIAISELEPSAASFLLNTPQAISLSTLRPYPSDIHHLPSLFAALETLVLLLLIILSVIFRRKKEGPQDPVLLFLLFFALSLLLVIGFSVNNLGAIVRYRSIILPFLLAPALARMNWEKLIGLISNGKNKKEPISST